MIYAALMTAGILEFIFAVLLALHFFDMEAEKEAEYMEGYADGYTAGCESMAFKYRTIPDDEYYDALVDEANCWFGIEGD